MMANILDYLDWRGDLSFAVVPFNEVDNLILSELSFLDYAGVAPQDFTEALPFCDVMKHLSEFRDDDSVETGILLPKDFLPLAEKAAKSVRFGEVRVCGFETRIDTRCEMQFAAVTFLLGDGTAFISFRGTDDTLVGWKEDFNMSFLSVVPSQSFAAQYLDRMATVYPQRLRIGGHSKGGNLAVYAAASASVLTQNRILQVYSNDGPGFSRSFLDSEGYARIRDRVRTIVPQTSVVGVLLEHECEYTIVKSTQAGLLQHDGFSWEVCGSRFVRVPDRTANSKRIDKTLKSWIASMNEAERAEFVDAVYTILCSTSAERLSDLFRDKDALPKIMRSITKEQRILLQRTFRSLIYTQQQVRREDRDEKREEKRLLKESAKEAPKENPNRKDTEQKREDRSGETQTRKNASETEKPLPKERKSEGKRSIDPPRRKTNHHALMVAVRPIEFRVVKASSPTKKQNASEKGGAEKETGKNEAAERKSIE